MNPIDYSTYSMDELYDVERNIDAEGNPENYQALMAEIEKRRSAVKARHAAAEDANPDTEFDPFTFHNTIVLLCVGLFVASGLMGYGSSEPIPLEDYQTGTVTFIRHIPSWGRYRSEAVLLESGGKQFKVRTHLSSDDIEYLERFERKQVEVAIKVEKDSSGMQVSLGKLVAGDRLIFKLKGTYEERLRHHREFTGNLRIIFWILLLPMSVWGWFGWRKLRRFRKRFWS